MFRLIHNSDLSQITYMRFFDFLKKYITKEINMLKVRAGNGELAELITKSFNINYQIYDKRPTNTYKESALSKS